MKENSPTKLTLSHADVTMSAELPWDANLNDIMDAFVGCLRGVSFGDWVVEGIKGWCEEHLPDDDEADDEAERE